MKFFTDLDKKYNNRFINRLKLLLEKRRKRKYLEGLFKEVAIDLMGNNHELRVFISMGEPHPDNKLAHCNQVTVSMNIKGKLTTVQFPLIKFIRQYGIYDLERLVLIEKYKPTVPVDLSPIISSIDSVYGLDKIVEEYGWKTKSRLIRHLVEHWEKEGRTKAIAEGKSRQERIQRAIREDRIRREQEEQERRRIRYGY